MMSFSGKTVAITGGGTGIGRACAKSFLDRGARVVLNGRRADILREAARELDPSGKLVRVVPGDVAQRETGLKLVSTAVDAFGGLDVLLNAAGIFKPTPFLEHTDADLEAYLGAILKGTFYTSQAAVPALRQRGGGAIVNVGSMWASQAVAATPSAAYSAAKAGVPALTHNLAIELGKDNIRVNTIAPAVVDTPVYRGFIPEAEVPAVLASFDAFHPLGRIGRTDDVVGAVVFLASEDARWITGVILPVDGGVMAGRC
jgi:NAD(P)-dependent dehydrogenase (short-subunit alcohol dehydrogenase family)